MKIKKAITLAIITDIILPVMINLYKISYLSIPTPLYLLLYKEGGA